MTINCLNKTTSINAESFYNLKSSFYNASKTSYSIFNKCVFKPFSFITTKVSLNLIELIEYVTPDIRYMLMGGIGSYLPQIISHSTDCSILTVFRATLSQNDLYPSFSWFQDLMPNAFKTTAVDVGTRESSSNFFSYYFDTLTTKPFQKASCLHLNADVKTVMPLIAALCLLFIVGASCRRIKSYLVSDPDYKDFKIKELEKELQICKQLLLEKHLKQDENINNSQEGDSPHLIILNRGE